MAHRITSKQANKKELERLSSGQEAVESSLQARLLEALNSEVCDNTLFIGVQLRFLGVVCHSRHKQSRPHYQYPLVVQGRVLISVTIYEELKKR